MPCRCKSYNRPDWGGDLPEVVLPKPAWSTRENGICVDSCIADAIQMLWANGIVTGGCCCGHNLRNPNVILEECMNEEDCQKAIRLLLEKDGRTWDVMQWRLVTIRSGLVRVGGAVGTFSFTGT